MRYFRAFYEVNDESRRIRGLTCLHTEFDDKAFVLPYYRRGCGEDDGFADFAVSVIIKNGSSNASIAQGYINKALEIWDVDADKQIHFEECTLEDSFMNSLCRVYTEGNFDESHVRRLLNLSSVYRFLSTSRIGLKEYVVENELTEARARELASETDYTESLQEELTHIYAPIRINKGEREREALSSKEFGEASSQRAYHAPITYIIEGNAITEAEDVIHLLLGAMQGANRAASRHLFYIDIDDYRRWNSSSNDYDYKTYINHQFLKVVEGNALVIRYGLFEHATGFDIEAHTILSHLLDLVEDAECETQLFISVPEGKQDLIMRLKRRHNKPIVRLSKDVGTNLAHASFENNLACLEEMAKARGIDPDESLGVLLSKRMRDTRGSELEGVFEEWATYQEARQTFPQYADVIDEAIWLGASDESVDATTRLNDLIGLESVKSHINNVLLRIEMGKKMLERGITLEPFAMHMAFLGAPGTGKTEVARLYAEILKNNGILSEGRLVTVSGGAGFNVRKSFEAAKGSVLFVDEAYGMYGFPDTIAEFIAQMENHRDDTVVILAGYDYEMNRLLSSNPGFRSRVQTIIKFPDYTNEELQQIFHFMCEKQSLVMGEGVEAAIRDITERGGKRADQGNARFVRKLFEDIVGIQQVRLAKRLKSNPDEELTLEDLRTLALEDIEEAARNMGVLRKSQDETGREALESLIGLDEVKKLVSARMDFAKIQKVKRDANMEAPYVPMHMAFKGNPGTGKTEVARIVGRILREEGVLSVGDFFECGQQDIVSPIPGQSAMKVEALFQEARGSVIFIDEAYSLLVGGRGGIGEEAVTALIDQMEKLRTEVVVIFAGYTDEIDMLLASNPGFNSRVKTQLEFPDYSVDELIKILQSMAKKQGYSLADDVEEKVRGILEEAAKDSQFGNARFVRNLLENAIVEQSVRLATELRERKCEVGADELSSEELAELVSDDFTWEFAKPAKPSIGFAA